MKKSFKLFLLMFCLIPLVLLSSCGITQYFTISTISSSLDYGTTNGGSLSALAEGTEVTITANEKKPDTNPFICWIKNNSKIVSFEKSYSMTYNGDTNGKYTALFQETSENINKTRYVAISNVEITNVNTGSLKIEYAYSTNTQNKILLEDISIVDGKTEPEKKNLLYFDTTNLDVTFNIYATLITKNNSSTSTTSIVFNNNSLVDCFSNLADNDTYITFDNEGNCTLESRPDPLTNMTVKITFSKVSLSLYNNVEN